MTVRSDQPPYGTRDPLGHALHPLPADERLGTRMSRGAPA